MIKNGMNNQPIIIEGTFDVSISKLWGAISDKNEMKHWYFDLKEFKSEVGFKFQFLGGPDEERQYLHLCEVTEVADKKNCLIAGSMMAIKVFSL